MTHVPRSASETAVPFRHHFTATNVTLAVIALAYLPLLTFHLRQLWSRPHYQFFPVYLAGLCGLLWTRSNAGSWTLRGSRWSRGACCGLSFLAATSLYVAVRLFSPWLASVSALMLTAAVIIVASPNTRRDVWPLWLAAWFVIPPPLGLDLQLIQWMQLGVAKMSSELLDVIGVMHLPLGATLALPEKHLLVEEACSGIRSLFALVACTLLYSLWARFGILRIVVLLVGACFTALLANVLRVVTIAVAYDSLAVDLSMGWPHELLGFAVFAIALGLMASLTVLVRTVFSPIGVPDEYSSGVIQFWNWLVEGRGGEQNLAYADDIVPASEQETEVSPTRASWGKMRQAVAGAVTIVFSLLLVLQYTLLSSDASISVSIPTPVSELITEALLPAQSDGWTMVDYQIRERAEQSESPRSNTWTYHCPTYSAIVSCDYPYTDAHDLSVCYRNIGWEIAGQRVVEASDQVDAKSPGPYQIVECFKPIDEYAYVLFSAFDGTGKYVDPPLISTKSLIHQFGRRLAGESSQDSAAEGIYQIQVVIFSDHLLSGAERTAATTQFFSFRHKIRDLWVRSNSE